MFLDRLKEWIAPTPHPELKPAPEETEESNAALFPRVDPEEIAEMEAAVACAARFNNAAATVSVATSHLAISAEERTRSMLKGLMQSMDRGNHE